MSATTSTALSRDLGDELRLLRETYSGQNGRAMAEQLGWDPSKVSNIENGKVRATDIDIVQYLTACGKKLEYIEAFRRRYYNAFDPYHAQTTNNLRTLTMTESSAEKITSYDVLTPPGLFQTIDYARALLTDGGIEAPEEVEKFAQARIQRQAVLRRLNGPECLFYVHELALRTQLGDVKTMEDQYLQLLFNTHIMRIVPMDAMHPGLLKDCVLYEFDNAAPVVFSDTDMAQLFAQDALAVKRAKRLFERLQAVALNEEQSKNKLMEYVSSLREDPHGSGTDLA